LGYDGLRNSLSPLPSSLPPSPPLPSLFPAHVLYWGSKDLANFILKETRKGEEGGEGGVEEGGEGGVEEGQGQVAAEEEEEEEEREEEERERIFV